MRPITVAGGALAAGAIVAVAFALARSDSPSSVSLSPALKHTQQARSRYLALAQDREVRAPATLLSTRLVLRRRDWVFVQTDGTYAPVGQGAAANVFIEIDGKRVTNESVIDWRESFTPVRHSFNAVGAARLSKGPHKVKLVAAPIAGAFAVSQSSNLSVLVHPAQRVSVTRLAQKAGPFDFTTLGRGRLDKSVPHKPVVSVAADTRSRAVALASGSAQMVGEKGDAMFGIYLDHRHPDTTSSLWTVNDVCFCAEVQAPVYTQALLEDGNRRSLVSLDATEYPWDQPGIEPFGEDTAVYAVLPGARLVVLGGQMGIVGKGAPDRSGLRKLAGTVWDWTCVANGSGMPRYCPRIGSNVRLSSETLTVPAGHSGVVMFAAKSRVQAGPHDVGGTAKLWLTVDGVRQGSLGVQQLAAPSSLSQRTISASYLAAGRHRLRPGKHKVEVYGRIDGSFDSVRLSRDLPLVWFD